MTNLSAAAQVAKAESVTNQHEANELRKLSRTYLHVAALSLTLSGCGGSWSNDCDSEIDDFVSAHGQPEEVERFDSGDYHSWSYWYWSKGIERTFVWSDDQSCKTSDYTFAPIH